MSEPAFDEIWGEAREAALEPMFGGSWTYTPPNSAGAAVTGVALLVHENGQAIVEVNGSATKDARTAICTVALTAVARPAKGGRFTDGRDAWTIASEPRLKDGDWEFDADWSRFTGAGNVRAANA